MLAQGLRHENKSIMHLSGHNERDRLDIGASDLICPRDFTFTDVQRSARQECNPTLRVGGFVLR